MIAVEILEAFGDNYIYLVEYGPGVCFAVDPGEAGPVEAVVSQRNIKLTHILTTHHHFDHIGGIKELKKKYGCRVVGPDRKRIPTLDILMQDGETIELETMTIRCIATPGHTAADVCYYMTGEPLEAPVLFTGDTLFVCGCGRLFGGNGKIMFNSLQKLADLPDETRVYPGHDYTAEDIQFALRYEPNNAVLKEKLAQAQQKMQSGRPTVPSTLGEERKLNPFLKAENWEKLADLRKEKDVF